MKIVIPGGSGQVGTMLARAFNNDGHDVVVLTRKIHAADWKVIAWDAETFGEWTDEINGADVVINLAGRHVNCRYTPENRKAIMDSRVKSTKIVGEAIANSKNPPRAWLQASTATIYAHRFDAPNDEFTGIIGGAEPGAPHKWNFSIDVVKAWERIASEAVTPDTRKILMRMAITMEPDRGGTFDVLLGLVKRGLGGTNGDGRQFVSWIHDADLIRSVYWLIDHEELSGPINVASPLPIPNKDFMRILRDAWGASFGIPSPKWLLQIGAYFMRTETELVLKSRRVVPKILTDSGFAFEFPLWEQAAKDLCRRWRHENHSA